MATSVIQIAFGRERMIELSKLKKADGVNLSDDLYAKKLLMEKIDEKLKSMKKEE